jgi:hypothetical protein
MKAQGMARRHLRRWLGVVDAQSAGADLHRRRLLGGLTGGLAGGLTARSALGMFGPLAALASSSPALALPAADAGALLDAEQSRRFRAWMTVLVHAQIEQGPSPRWVHRDCAGLVRFAVGEALRPHDLRWRQANGLVGQPLPADVDESAARPWQQRWRRHDGSRQAYVGALELVQENTNPVGRALAQAQAGDLLAYDFGDDQHLMVWMGRYAAYHTGHADAGDNGLRAWRAQDLARWPDTRWRPDSSNPNFLGVYRFAFLSR